MVRLATQEDIPRAIQLGVKYHEMTAYSGHIPINPDSFAILLKQIIIESAGLFLVVEKDGVVTGGLAAIQNPFYFNFDYKCAQLLFWYAEESSRDNIRLWNAFEEWADGSETVAILAGCNAILMKDKFEKFWTKKGYTPLEMHMIKWKEGMLCQPSQ